MNDHDQQVDLMASAFRKVLSEGAPDGEGERVILVKRIPIICNDVIQIKEDMAALRKQAEDDATARKKSSDELKPYLDGVAGIKLIYHIGIAIGAMAVGWAAIKGVFHF